VENNTIDALIDNAPKLGEKDLLSAIKDASQELSENKSLSSSSKDTTESYDPMAPYFMKPHKGKNIDITNLSQSEIKRRDLTSNNESPPLKTTEIIMQDNPPHTLIITQDEVPIKQPEISKGSLLAAIKSFLKGTLTKPKPLNDKQEFKVIDLAKPKDEEVIKTGKATLEELLQESVALRKEDEMERVGLSEFVESIQKP